MGIETDLEFIKAFLEYNGKYENCIANIESMSNVIINCSAETFGLTQEEFNKRCHVKESDLIKNNEE